MSKVNTAWNLGNFSVSLEAEVSEEQFQALANYGLRFLGQRQSAVDKILGAFVVGADGKAKRKAGWKRGEVNYSAELAESLEGVFTLMEMDDESILEVGEVRVVEYIRDVAEAKYDMEKGAMERHESAGDLEDWLKVKIGYTGETHGEDGEFSVKALAAIRAFVKEEARKRNAEL